MNLFFKFSIFVSTLALTSCFNSAINSSDEQLTILDYDSVRSSFIELEDVFSQKEDEYYVYFFSRNCSHCNSVKEFMIDKIIDRKGIFLVEANDKIHLTSDDGGIIGCNCIDCFAIVGYPTLVKIINHVVEKTFIGTEMIKKELTN